MTITGSIYLAGKPAPGLPVIIENTQGVGINWANTDAAGVFVIDVPSNSNPYQWHISTDSIEAVGNIIGSNLGRLDIEARAKGFPWWLLLVGAGAWYVIKEKRRR
jgi:hypothetical protein